MSIQLEISKWNNFTYPLISSQTIQNKGWSLGQNRSLGFLCDISELIDPLYQKRQKRILGLYDMTDSIILKSQIKSRISEYSFCLASSAWSFWTQTSILYHFLICLVFFMYWAWFSLLFVWFWFSCSFLLVFFIGCLWRWGGGGVFLFFIWFKKMWKLLYIVYSSTYIGTCIFCMFCNVGAFIQVDNIFRWHSPREIIFSWENHSWNYS